MLEDRILFVYFYVSTRNFTHAIINESVFLSQIIIQPPFRFFFRAKAARAACSNTSRTPSLVLAEHSR